MGSATKKIIEQQAREASICDDCALIAYDKKIGVVYEWNYDDLDEWEKAEEAGNREKVNFMVEAGGMIEDHDCSAKIDPDIQCDCGCNKREV